MSILNLPSTIRSVNRLRVIVGVFSRHGFGGMLQKLNLGRFIPFRRRLTADIDDLHAPHVWGARLAAALQELGPTFIKLGQILSSRPDLLPDSFIRELKTLQDRVPPSDPDAVRLHLEAELGGPVEKYFHEFDWTPFGGGSIAQVHFATTRDGERVVVKVRRPGIDKLMRADGELLEALAGLLERRIPESRIYRPVVIADEFARSCEQEMDFISEAAATNRFHEAFKDDPHIVIPRVRWDLTRSGVLTLNRLSGKNISNPDALTEFAVKRDVVAVHLLDAFVKQFFLMGQFHGDPHPGNLMAMGPERIAILDFGLVGHLSDDMRDKLVTALLAALNREMGLVVQIFTELGSISEDTQVEELKSDAQKLLDKYSGLNLGRFALDRLFTEITDLCRRHRVILPRDFVMIIKSLITIAGVGMTLYPQLDLVAVLMPRLKSVLWDKVHPGKVARRMILSLWHLQNVVTEAPAQVSEFLRKAVRGQLTVNVKMPAVEHLAKEFDKTGNRATLGIVIAGGLIGSSMMLASRVPPLVAIWGAEDGISLFGLVGYVTCAVGGLMLLRAIFKSGRLS